MASGSIAVLKMSYTCVLVKKVHCADGAVVGRRRLNLVFVPPEGLAIVGCGVVKALEYEAVEGVFTVTLVGEIARKESLASVRRRYPGEWSWEEVGKRG